MELAVVESVAEELMEGSAEASFERQTLVRDPPTSCTTHPSLCDTIITPPSQKLPKDRVDDLSEVTIQQRHRNLVAGVEELIGTIDQSTDVVRA